MSELFHRTLTSSIPSPSVGAASHLLRMNNGAQFLKELGNRVLANGHTSNNTPTPTRNVR